MAGVAVAAAAAAAPPVEKSERMDVSFVCVCSLEGSFGADNLIFRVFFDSQLQKAFLLEGDVNGNYPTSFLCWFFKQEEIAFDAVGSGHAFLHKDTNLRLCY